MLEILLLLKFDIKAQVKKIDWEKKCKKGAVTRIRTWVIAATTQCPNL